MSLLELLCDIDDFWQVDELFWYQDRLANGKQRLREGQMSMSEMTIVVYFHQNIFEFSKPITHSV